ncbi:MAG: hypothetical protein JWQ55_3654, partial [Rhodopila sp.]|nr:hypothetical protein [Rhodopila sp.]
LHRFFVRIQQQPQWETADAKIAEQLRLMHRQDLLHGFDFQDHDA